MDAVVCPSQNSLDIPFQSKLVTLAFFKPLIILDDVQLKLRGNPRGKLKGNILVGISTATIPPSLRDQTDGTGGFDPLLRRQDKSIGTGCISKLVEFDPVKIGVIQLFPKTQILYRAAVAKPVFYNIGRKLRITVAGNIGQRNIVILTANRGNNGDL